MTISAESNFDYPGEAEDEPQGAVCGITSEVSAFMNKDSVWQGVKSNGLSSQVCLKTESNQNPHSTTVFRSKIDSGQEIHSKGYAEIVLPY